MSPDQKREIVRLVKTNEISIKLNNEHYYLIITLDLKIVSRIVDLTYSLNICCNMYIEKQTIKSTLKINQNQEVTKK